MTSLNEKQGYLENLESKPLPELKDLLHRQQKIIANEKFVKKLPDRGEKIRRMTQQLQSIIKSRDNVDQSAMLFEKLSLNAERSRASRGEEISPVLKDIINTEVQEKIVTDERVEDGYDDFARIMKKVDVIPDKQKYLPGRTVKHTTIKDMTPESLPIEPAQSNRELNKGDCEAADALARRVQKEQHATLQDMPLQTDKMVHRLKYNYDESLMASLSWNNESARKAKLITLEESIQVLEKQRQQHEELRAQQAVEKLAQRLSVPTQAFDPEGSRKMEIHVEDSDEEAPTKDSDDEQELDYPD